MKLWVVEEKRGKRWVPVVDDIQESAFAYTTEDGAYSGPVLDSDNRVTRYVRAEEVAAEFDAVIETLENWNLVHPLKDIALDAARRGLKAVGR